MARLLTKPPGICLSLLPADADDGVATCLWKARVMPIQAHDRGPARRLMNVAAVRIREAGFLHESGVLIARNLICADRERSRDPNAMPRLLFACWTLMRIFGSGSHEIDAGRHDDHF